MILSKRSNGIYYVFYFQSNGKRTCISTGSKIKSDALKFLSKFESELHDRQQYKTIPILLKDFIFTFLKHSETIHSENTTKVFKVTFNFLMEYFGNILITDITSQSLDGYFQKRIKESSIYPARKDYINLSSAFNYAIKQKHLLENPCKEIKRFKIPEKQPLWFSETDFEILLRTIDDSDIKDLVVFAVNTGLREMELLTLTWNQIDFKNKLLVLDNQIHVTKSKRVRSIPLNLKAIQILTERQINHNSELVFTLKGKAINQNYISKKFKKYVVLAGLNNKLNFHSLRSSFASWLIQKGVSITNVSKILGHSSVRVTESHYAFLRPSDLMDSVNKLNN